MDFFFKNVLGERGGGLGFRLHNQISIINFYSNLPHSAGPYSGNGHCLRLLLHTKLFKNHEPKVL